MVYPIFFLKKNWWFFSHRPLESDDLFSCRLLTTPIFPRRLSSVHSKFRHNKLILFGCHPLDGVTRCGASDATVFCRRMQTICKSHSYGITVSSMLHSVSAKLVTVSTRTKTELFGVNMQLTNNCEQDDIQHTCTWVAVITVCSQNYKWL